MILRSDMTRQDFLKLSAAAALAGASVSEAQQKANADLGFTDTPMLPNLPYHVHDPDRPHPKIVTPANTPFGPPSDATVLFDGKDLSKWNQRGRGADRGKMADAQWKVGDGYFEVAPGTGDLLTRQKFGDCQLHVEWSSPVEVRGTSQARGNSGVLLMSRYEIQVLDMWDNKTYADGQAGAIYGQWPPLANPARRPGEWNTYDILFEAPRFEGEKVVKPVIFTVIYNGVVVQNHKASMGPMVYRQVAHYTPHAPEEPLMLQDHHNPVRYRNIWIRPLGTYDHPA
jgi:3-keto-disaccharide hydrolase